MKRKILSALLLICFAAVNGNVAGLLSSNVSAQSDVVLIKEGVGIEKIEVGKSTADDVIAYYGTKYELIEHGSYSYEMYFKKRCLSFYYKHNDDAKNIFTISIKSPCKAVTTKGITLGEDTLQDVKRIYGEAEPLTTTANKTWFYEYSGIEFNVMFDSWEEVNTPEFLQKKIVEIDITIPEYFKPPVTTEEEDEETDSSVEDDG